MSNFKFKWYTIVVLLLVIVLCVLMSIGYAWARYVLAILTIVFIVFSWIREFVRFRNSKKNSSE